MKAYLKNFNLARNLEAFLRKEGILGKYQKLNTLLSQEAISVLRKLNEEWVGLFFKLVDTYLIDYQGQIDLQVLLHINDELYKVALLLCKKYGKSPSDWSDIECTAKEDEDLMKELMTHEFSFLFFSIEPACEVTLNPLIEQLIEVKANHTN